MKQSGAAVLSLLWFVATLPVMLAQLVKSCFLGGIQEMVYCCDLRADPCFTASGRYSHLSKQECCSASVVTAMMESLASHLAETSEQEELAGIAQVFKVLILGMQLQRWDAWEMLGASVSKLALARYDALTDRGVEAVFSDSGNSTDAATAALYTARELNYAAHLCETLFQVLVFDTARKTGRSAVEVTPDEVRGKYAGTLIMYRLLHRALGSLTYLPVGRNSQEMPSFLPPLAGLPHLLCREVGRGVRRRPGEAGGLLFAGPFRGDVEEAMALVHELRGGHFTLYGQHHLEIARHDAHQVTGPREAVSYSCAHAGDEVVLVFTVVGRWANVGAFTFWSVLRHRSTPLRIFIFGDQEGLHDWRRLVVAIEGASPAALHGVRFEYIEVFEHPRLKAYLEQLPGGCAESKMSIALFARLICHELLPEDVKRAIAMDLGDIVVFDDIAGLWREGDMLGPEQLMAVASHRAHEEEMRHGKPSTLNGGVVVYEVGAMRNSNYTADTLHAAHFGLAAGYKHFCAWDQDIINVLHADVWQESRVRVLPCRWSLFPVTGWQWWWNTPNRWIADIFRLRRYPGLQSAYHIEHVCPDEIQLFHHVFTTDDPHQKAFVRDFAINRGRLNSMPGGSHRAADGSQCLCGERASLLHVPSTMKLWPWSHDLFEHHHPRFLARAEGGANFNTRQEKNDNVEEGGGFWGSEDTADLDAMNDQAMQWARDKGGVMALGRCATLPSNGQYNYMRVDFQQPPAGAQVAFTIETTAKSDVHVFLGKISPDMGKMTNTGIELVIGLEASDVSVLRWGARGLELSRYSGEFWKASSFDTSAGRPGWSRFWLSFSGAGAVSAGNGGFTGDDSTVLVGVKANAVRQLSVSTAELYVATIGQEHAKWFICHH